MDGQGEGPTGYVFPVHGKISIYRPLGVVGGTFTGTEKGSPATDTLHDTFTVQP